MVQISVREFKNYIDGKWSDSSSGEILEVFCPGDGQLVTRVPKSTKADMERAIAAAKRAFYQEDWAFNPRRRSQAMFAWAALMRANLEEVATILSLETGKPIGEARFETNGAINYLEYYAAATRTLYGSTNAVDKTTLSVLAREPVGVVGGIIPWNYPVTLFMRDMAPAIAAGNTIVVKPAAITSGSGQILLELADKTGLFPAGTLNCVTGAGSSIGEVLISHEDVDMISFTGSTSVGQHIMEVGSKTMKKLSLELGGKSPNVIFADANLEKALPFAIKGIFTNAGQLCTVGSRVLIEESIADTFIPRLKAAAEALKVGHGLDPNTQMGPVSSKKQLEDVMAFIEEGKKCSKLITGGYRINDGELAKGCFVAPTIFLNPPMDSHIVQEEIFGPVLVIQTFKTEEEAVEIANGTKYGLASAVWTKDIDKALRVSRRIRAGSCWINCYNKLLPECETGGYKQSGVDRAGGVEGLMKYTEVKHIGIDFA